MNAPIYTSEIDENKTRFTVIGAGHGGKAMAAHLALMGFPTKLYNRTAANIEFIRKRGGIELESYEGGPSGFGRLVEATSDMEEALRDSQVIMVVVPSNAHHDVAEAAAKHLVDGQIVLLNPGRTLGALEFDKTIRDNGCTADVLIAEAETFLYASRSDGPSQARIFRIKDSLPLAALPAIRTQEVLDAISPAFPQFISGENVLHTSLNNMGTIFHPALTILNAGRIESTGGDYQYYIEGATPSVARVLEAMDRERVTVASAMGIRAQTAMEWLQRAYSAHGENLYESIQNQTGYYGITAPKTLNHRYIFEDVPFSLVPIADLGKQYGVSVRCIDSIIRLACVIHRTDYWRRGRTLAKLGIQGLSVSELTHYVMDGVRVF
jgi:opine dehydrogenase